jgi:hypothetical protein
MHVLGGVFCFGESIRMLYIVQNVKVPTIRMKSTRFFLSKCLNNFQLAPDFKGCKSPLPYHN